MDKENVVVSISCITFNQAPYIRECFEGFLSQKTDFKFEILVHDDASTDGTREIIEEYTKNYPHLFFPIIQTENQYSKGVRGMNKYNILRAKGKYIALCEGDDYWIDPLKLQKQVDFLEENHDCSMVFSNAKVIIEDSGSNNNIVRGLIIIKKSQIFSGIDILEKWTVPTASVLFRKSDLDIEFAAIATNKKFLFGDIVLFLYMSTKGYLYGMKDFMVTYRRHQGGATNFNLSVDLDKKFGEHYMEIINVFGKQFKKPLAGHIGRVYFSQALNALKKGDLIYFANSILKVIQYKPNIISDYLRAKFYSKGS